MSIDCNISIANLTLWKPRHGEEEVCPLLVAAEAITSRSVLWQLTVECLSQHNACLGPCMLSTGHTKDAHCVRCYTRVTDTDMCCTDLERDFETEWKLVWTGANWSVVAESTEWPSHSLILVWCMHICCDLSSVANYPSQSLYYLWNVLYLCSIEGCDTMNMYIRMCVHTYVRTYIKVCDVCSLLSNKGEWFCTWTWYQCVVLWFVCLCNITRHHHTALTLHTSEVTVDCLLAVDLNLTSS